MKDRMKDSLFLRAPRSEMTSPPPAAANRLAAIGNALLSADARRAAVGGIPAAAHSPTEGPYTTGAGPMRYAYCPDRLQLPAGLPVRNGHAMSVDASGRIYFAYDPSTQVR
jgi:hypothetical protein